MFNRFLHLVHWVLSKATKTTTVSNFLFYMLVIGIVITVSQSILQAERIKLLQATNERMNEIAERRLAMINKLDQNIDSLKKTINDQNTISKRQLDYERELREKQDAQLSTIQELLQNNQCADVELPTPLLDQLQQPEQQPKK